MLGVVVFALGIIAVVLWHRDSGPAKSPRGFDPNTPGGKLYETAVERYHRSDYRGTLAAAQEAFVIATRTGDSELEATVLLLMFGVFYDLGDLDRAQEAVRRAELRLRPGDPRQAYPPLYRGIVFKELGRYALAHQAYSRALELAESHQNTRLARSARLNLSELALRRQKPAEAQVYLSAVDLPSAPASLLQGRIIAARGAYREAADVFESAMEMASSDGWRWRIELARADALALEGRLAGAEAAYRRAMGYVEKLREDFGVDDLNPRLLAQKRDPYEGLFQSLAQGGRALEALAVLEQAKARSFLDVYLRPNRNSAAAVELFDDTAPQRAKALEKLLPRLEASPVTRLRPARDIVAAVGERRLLSYFKARDTFWVAVLHRGRVALHSLSISPKRVEAWVAQYRAEPDNLDLASRLGEALLPEAVLPADAPAMLVAPDGVLGQLSFAGLRRRGRYVVEDTAVQLVPSASAWLTLQEQPSPKARGPAVVVADPRENLPHAAAEGRQVAAKHDATFFVGASAHARALMRAREASLLHVAAHAGMGPLGAWLELADRRLSPGDIVDLGLRPGLTVLAGCATAAREGTELWGSLATAFLVSGSRSVVASLVSVSDEAASALLRLFYQRQGAQAPTLALAQAQREAIKQGWPPSRWTPFVVMGAEPL